MRVRTPISKMELLSKFRNHPWKIKVGQSIVELHHTCMYNVRRRTLDRNIEVSLLNQRARFNWELGALYALGTGRTVPWYWSPPESLFFRLRTTSKSG